MTRVSAVIRSNAAFIIGAVAICLIASELGRRGSVDTAAGVVTGGLLALAAGYVLRWRSRRRETATTADRVAAGRADERDRAVLTGALATTGVGGLLLAAVGSLLVSLGVEAELVVAVSPYVLMALFAVGFAVTNRRI